MCSNEGVFSPFQRDKGRGREARSQLDGRLRGGASQWRNRLRETEGSVAGCFLKKTKHSDKKRSARALARSSCHADFRRAAFCPTEVRVQWGSASQVCFSQLSLGIEERFNAQTFRSSAT